ncbi:MAG: DMT family transporter [Anaerolineales bacterium]|nr:DMT family transporter [Anaerolineales bacterium]
MADSIEANFSRFGTSLRLGIGVLALSVSSILIRFCHAPSLTISIYRLTIAFLCIMPINLMRQNQLKIRTISQTSVLFIVISSLCLALHFWLWISSVETTSITKSTVLVTTSPIFVTLLNWLIQRSLPPRYIFISICLSTTGTFILVYEQSMFGSFSQGDGLAIIAAACMAGYLTAGHKALKMIPIQIYITGVYGLSSVMLLLLALFLQTDLTGFDKHTYLFLILIGLIPQLIGHSLINSLLRDVHPGPISIAILGEPLGASVLAWIFLDEIPTYVTILGGTIILYSVGFVIRHYGSTQNT